MCNKEFEERASLSHRFLDPNKIRLKDMLSWTESWT